MNRSPSVHRYHLIQSGVGARATVAGRSQKIIPSSCKHCDRPAIGRLDQCAGQIFAVRDVKDAVAIDADRQRVGVVVDKAVVVDRRADREAKADDCVVLDGDDADLRNGNTSPW